jgi:hypothetical protein
VNFAALRTAVSDRGFARLSSSQLGQVVNDAVHELDGMEPRWPYLQTTTTGTAPLTVSDYVDVTDVLNTTLNRALLFTRYEDLARWAGDLTQSATDPTWWYFTPGSTTSISTFPVTTRTIKVVYYKASQDLSADGDTPLAPARWHHVIVDLATRNAHRQKGDHASAEAVQADIDRKLALMRTDLLFRQVVGPAQVLDMGIQNY